MATNLPGNEPPKGTRWLFIIATLALLQVVALLFVVLPVKWVDPYPVVYGQEGLPVSERTQAPNVAATPAPAVAATMTQIPPSTATGAPLEAQQTPAPEVSAATNAPDVLTPSQQPASFPININLASAEQLMALPGVGPVIAARIVAEREQNGAFMHIADIVRVSGIGTATFEKLKDLIAV